MNVIKCINEQTLETNYNFLEVSITPLQSCDNTQKERDELYSMLIDFYMNHFATVTSCVEGLTTLSSYIKMNCVEACYGFSPEGPAPIFYVPCSTGAQGCCIEQTRWCRDDEEAIQLESLTNTVPGDCTGDLEGSCGNTPLGPGCRPDRCN